MTTLIAVYNSDGCVGRCDARCYNATSSVCVCICGGKNHGVGKAQAIVNTMQMVCENFHISSEQLDEFITANNLPARDDYKTTVNINITHQMALSL